MPKRSTKAACIKALTAIHPDAKLDDLSNESSYDVEVEAPKFMSWGGQVHCRVFNQRNDGLKAEFWGEVLQEINQLPKLESCKPTCDVEGINGTCEFWLEDV